MRTNARAPWLDKLQVQERSGRPPRNSSVRSENTTPKPKLAFGGCSKIAISTSGCRFFTSRFDVQESDNLAKLDRRAVSSNDECACSFAELAIGHGDNCGLSYPRMHEQVILDILGRNFFAAPVDDVFRASFHQFPVPDR